MAASNLNNGEVIEPKPIFLRSALPEGGLFACDDHEPRAEPNRHRTTVERTVAVEGDNGWFQSPPISQAVSLPARASTI